MGFLKALKRCFRLSDFPLEQKTQMEREGLLFLAEGVRVTAVYQRFKAQGKRFRNKRETAWGSLAVSRKRITGFCFRKRVIHLPLDSDEVKSVKFSLVDGKVLIIDVDPSLFDPRRSGRIQVRYHTERAPEAYGIIRKLTGS